MTISKTLLTISIFTFLTSCSYILTDHKNDYLKEKQTKSIVLPDNQSSRPIVDYFPINTEDNEQVGTEYEIPMPQQVFSSGTSNEVRMHKLGELRWVYVETLPSSAWPVMKDFWSVSKYGLSVSNPNTGIIESKVVQTSGNDSKLIMKIEHGIRQASSEVFVSHVVQQKGDWVRVSGEDNLEAKVLRQVLDYFASSPSSGGTSLVALNLNYGQKAVLKQSDDNKDSFIELNLEYARSWAAVDRALKEALITINDLDRDQGVFFVEFSKQEEKKGFLRRLFSGESFKGNYQVIVKEVNDNTCLVTIISDGEESKLYERDLLSEINQSLS
jgi:outer membrane protein assembly factor BamC